MSATLQILVFDMTHSYSRSQPYVYMAPYEYIHICIYVYICTCIYIYIYMYICIHVFLCTLPCVYFHTLHTCVHRKLTATHSTYILSRLIRYSDLARFPKRDHIYALSHAAARLLSQ